MMDVLALTSNQHHLWSVTLIAGAVVLIAVVVLLSTLIALVKVIDRRVVEVRDTLKAAAANSSHRPPTVWMLCWLRASSITYSSGACSER